MLTVVPRIGVRSTAPVSRWFFHVSTLLGTLAIVLRSLVRKVNSIRRTRTEECAGAIHLQRIYVAGERSEDVNFVRRDCVSLFDCVLLRLFDSLACTGFDEGFSGIEVSGNNRDRDFARLHRSGVAETALNGLQNVAVVCRNLVRFFGGRSLGNLRVYVYRFIPPVSRRALIGLSTNRQRVLNLKPIRF